MSRALPGADKYRQAVSGAPAPWQDPLVVKANTEVRIEAVLNDYFGMHVPMEADRWKARCPLAREHDDGGLDRQFRVYSSSNTGHCFALHGMLDPVRLWRLRAPFPTIRDAAEDLMTAFGIEWRARPYWERMAALNQPAAFHADADVLVQTFQVFLSTLPGYEARQYEENVLRGVNYFLSEVHTLCARATSVEELESWLQAAKLRMTQLLAQP